MDEGSPIFEFQLAEQGGTASVATLILQLRQFVKDSSLLSSVSEWDRNELKRLLQIAARSLEEPFDTINRLGYSPLPLVSARIAQDHGIFKSIIRSSRSGKSVTLLALSQATGIKSSFLEPFLDYLCSQDMIGRVHINRFRATEMTKLLSKPRNEDSIAYFHDVVLPGFAAMNHKLYQPSTTRTAWQIGHDTQLDFYRWLDHNPNQMTKFQSFMTNQFAGLPTWLDVFPFDSALGSGLVKADCAFVDIGGGNGQQCQALKKHLPNLHGRVINQDRPEVLRAAPRTTKMELMPHDYLSKQPIQGAGMYYLRQILHNCNDKTSIEILEHQARAMSADSVVVIDEKVLPDDRSTMDVGASAYTSSLNLTMGMIFNAQERSQSHWNSLAYLAGLVIRDVRPYTQYHDAVIIATLKQDADPVAFFSISV